MYQRQWFSIDSHLALSSQALEVEMYVRQHNYPKALSLCHSFFDDTKKNNAKSYWRRQFFRIQKLDEYHRKSLGKLKIWFDDFWHGFNYYDNEIINLFKCCCNNLGLALEVSSDSPNILISSCFGSNYSSTQTNFQATKFLYLGENVRPSFGHIDYSLSFDFERKGRVYTYRYGSTTR